MTANRATASHAVRWLASSVVLVLLSWCAGRLDSGTDALGRLERDHGLTGTPPRDETNDQPGDTDQALTNDEAVQPVVDHVEAAQHDEDHAAYNKVEARQALAVDSHAALNEAGHVRTLTRGPGCVQGHPPQSVLVSFVRSSRKEHWKMRSTAACCQLSTHTAIVSAHSTTPLSTAVGVQSFASRRGRVSTLTQRKALGS